MEVRHEENWGAVREARARVARIVLNVAPAGAVPVAALDDIDVLVMNRLEAASVARDLGLGPSGDEPLTLARALATRHGITAIVTLGADGSVAATNEGDWRLGALAVDVVDTTGAGDAFVGVLTAGLDATQPIEAALHRASVAGGLACRKHGAQPSLPWAADIDAALAQLSPPTAIAPA
jgi:ribokinase